MEAINRQTWKQRMASYKRTPLSFLLLVLVTASALFTVCILAFLLIYILVKGIPYLTPSLFAWEYNSENVSLMPALINTILMTALSLVIAVPLGIFAAIYLVEYARRGNKIVGIVRITAETLTGIPSIVYGLFGFLLFGVALKWGYSMLGGALTLAIMILPSIINVAMTALEAVPREYEDASLALGATETETWFKVSVPAARSGIAAAVVLGVGRAIGEAMAVMMVSGNVPNMPSLFQSVRFLTTAVASEMSYAAAGLQRQALFSIALVLFLFIMLINAALNFFLKRSKEK